MKRNSVIASVVTTVSLFLAGGAMAETFVGGSQITPSTSLVPVNPWVIGEIADGITSDAPPFNGFVSNATSGTITLDLNASYNIDGFMLWNDVNVFREGIAHFRLDFFDASLNAIGSSNVFLGPQGQVAPATFSFATVNDVHRVNLVVLDVNGGVFSRIEIREVGFLSPVPEPASLSLLIAGILALCCLDRTRRGARERAAPA